MDSLLGLDLWWHLSYLEVLPTASYGPDPERI